MTKRDREAMAKCRLARMAQGLEPTPPGCEAHVKRGDWRGLLRATSGGRS